MRGINKGRIKSWAQIFLEYKIDQGEKAIKRPVMIARVVLWYFLIISEKSAIAVQFARAMKKTMNLGSVEITVKGKIM